MTAPLVIRRPKLVLQPVDADLEDEGDAVDVSCDVNRFELQPDLPTTEHTTFCGSFQIPGELTVTNTTGISVNTDTDANWDALVGLTVRAMIWDREDATKHRHFITQVGFNPSLFGNTTPGEPRTVDMTLPVMGEVAWEDGGYTAPVEPE